MNRNGQWSSSLCWIWWLPQFQQTVGKKYLRWSCKNIEKDGETDSNHVQGFDCSWAFKRRKYTFQQRIIELVNWKKYLLILSWILTKLRFCTLPLEIRHWSLKEQYRYLLRLNGKAKQITGTFTVLASRKWLPMQLIYAAKAERSHLQGIKLGSEFDVINSENYCCKEILSAPYWCYYSVCETAAWGTRII